ncbi:hypothetical protein M427DRAFT_384629 [Gonapodya prolifera JEL478]|uniref:Uncharacterized protein n=1 Tax=Gonapodya prolifera (strain JEL478) TaxID=1344416 RepID=A0A139A988_GONPJ|nr:hypothetical protein M427DRAFT_384629 [Gonapodya prolifera JEL478]|eukprot:KXS13035.1 hypothetical protein M427DRAFT_384629 [Gonapodya prolifera JEL478]
METSIALVADTGYGPLEVPNPPEMSAPQQRTAEESQKVETHRLSLKPTNGNRFREIPVVVQSIQTLQEISITILAQSELAVSERLSQGNCVTGHAMDAFAEGNGWRAIPPRTQRYRTHLWVYKHIPEMNAPLRHLLLEVWDRWHLPITHHLAPAPVYGQEILRRADLYHQHLEMVEDV